MTHLNDDIAEFLLGQHPLMSKEEERQQATLIRSGDFRHKSCPHCSEKHGPIERFVRANLRLVVAMATRRKWHGAEIGDLLCYGTIGLMHAAHGFDPNRARFSTHATFWVAQSMRRGYLREVGLITVPDHVHSALRILHVTGKHSPQVPASHVLAASRVSRIPSFDDPDLCFMEPTSRGRSTMDEVEHREIEEHVRRMVHTLPQRHRFILEQRFGLTDHPPKTLAQVGVCLSLSRERVRQLENEALCILRREPFPRGPILA